MMVILYASIHVQEQVVLGNLCWNVHIQFRHFSFKAILLYGRVHIITAALSFKPQIIMKNVLQTVDSFMRRNNYDYIK